MPASSARCQHIGPCFCRATHLVQHRSPFQSDGRCPVCRRPLDEGCQLITIPSPAPRWVALSCVTCAGVPTTPLASGVEPLR
jgi:hypothetical protein